MNTNNLITAEDALQKWCPFSRTAVDPARHASGPLAVASINRGGSEEVKFECNCIADRCMAWRTVEIAPIPGINRDTKYLGYCGMGGDPRTRRP